MLIFRYSAEMKKGRLYEVLGDIFRFVETRIHKIAKDLQGITHRGHFMDDSPYDAKKRKQSTRQRRGEAATQWQISILPIHVLGV